MAQQDNQMGVDSIRSVGNLQRNFLWNVVLPDIAGFNGMTDIGVLAQQVRFGDYNVDSPSTMRVGPLQAFFASLLSVPQFQITFLVPNPNILADYLAAWKLLIVGTDGLFFPKNSYAKSMYVRFLDQQGNVSGQYKMVGCFPIVFPYYQLGYTENTLTQVPITFKVDKIEYTDTSNE